MGKVTRRKFIIDGSIIFGGSLGCMALGRDLLGPNSARAAEVEFPESSCGLNKKTGKKVLVAYASYCGTTGNVAESIGQVLCDRGATVDVRLVENVHDLSNYEAVIIGSAVRSSSWRPEAIEFVENNRKILGQVPVAYFLTCLALYKDTDKSRTAARRYMEPALNVDPGLQPVGMGLFAGVLDYSRLNLMFRMVMKYKMKKRGVPEGDFRNWAKIRSWADRVSSPLLTP
ncbi:flavodoxin domain-containing protein [Thermodesulfobacteriota bacterium]